MQSNIGSTVCNVCGKTVAEHGNPHLTVAEQIRQNVDVLAAAVVNK